MRRVEEGHEPGQQPLPIADLGRTTRSIFDWLERFAACVRAVDYACRPSVLAFRHHLVRHLPGTDPRPHALDRDGRWDNAWLARRISPSTSTNTAVLIGDGNMATVITPWTSTGFRGRQPVRSARTSHHHPRAARTDAGSAFIPMSLQRGAPGTAMATGP